MSHILRKEITLKGVFIKLKMFIMKKILFLATTVLLFLAFNVNAQQRGPRERPTPEQQATRMVERLNQELKLTDKQQTELKTWFTDSFKKRNEAFEKNRENREAMRSQMQKDREETEAELKKVLTEEQYKTYKANEEKRQKERQQRGQGHQGGNRGGGFPRN